ncbi:hypothetical protein PVAND_005611 [Polypedilum vanderplanki]|uniref:Phosphoribosylformylglycinamidine synthase n=1 Tax=Polypedilum vanderplanki TaxID=319348 RepID=A0A9J6C1K0_POLVA|nr:hypothetical protein PVAND_005611 [Polypedilum vanderplanki]
MPISRFYNLIAFDEAKINTILKDLRKIYDNISCVKTEKSFHVELIEGHSLSNEDEKKLRWILKNTQEKDNLTKEPSLKASKKNHILIEIGPRFNFSTAESTNSVSICHSIHLTSIIRIETSIRYLIELDENSKLLTAEDELILVDHLSDRMTQCRYTDENIPHDSFDERLPKEKESWFYVPVLTQGRKALQEVNSKMGLAFDNWDLDYYTDLFTNVLKRDPTSTELFDCAQSNSEHSRHWFFKGRMIIDGKEEEKSLIKMIIDTQNYSNQNNTIKFSDNSSAIKGFKCKTLHPTSFIEPGKMETKEVDLDLIFTAETHNMPTTVAPFPGATTGTGGRIRDVQGVGRGGHTIAGTAGYCVGVLNIPDYHLPYETQNQLYPPSFASPLKIIIEASNGASDYGNKFGEPVLSGFAISYGLTNAQNERDEYVKSIMFSGGLGTMDGTYHRKKIDPERGMLLAKIGGPVYRIGVGGGAASSVEVQGDNKCELDFNAVQRGDAEMENKLNRVVRACIEMGDENPILAIHDQGAGGNGNVLKELVEPNYAGAVIFSKEFQLGDPTINALELWAAEYQENNAILCKPEDRKLLTDICERERCPINFVGVVTGNGYVTLIEEKADFKKYLDRENIPSDVPFDMNLKYVLGEMPRKVFDLERKKKSLMPLKFLDDDCHYQNYLDRVLSILAVGSKRFLTNKVDRCVTGLIVQQQCVGPLHTPLADYALTLTSHFEKNGIATSIGTQPIKGLINAEAGARMSIAEAISNLVFVKITELADVKCSGNWMWAAKLPGEGAKMYDACKAMCEMMKELNIAVDGGKDSLSMAARVSGETVKSPGTLVISTYAPCPDVTLRITPDLKAPSENKVGELIWINIDGKFRLGASALAQSLKQQGNDSPDIENVIALKNAFNVTQKLLEKKLLLSGHDISDGGLIVCLIEMAIGGMCGISVDLKNAMKIFKLEETSIENVLKILFAEECGWILECKSEHLKTILDEYKNSNVNAIHIGKSKDFGMQSRIKIMFENFSIIDMTTLEAIKKWERTSFEFEKLQMNLKCAEEEYNSYDLRSGPKYFLSFNPDDAIKLLKKPSDPWRVAVIREEGVNGDREMIAALLKANFEVYDVTMSDLLDRKAFLENYRGIIFPGGFSYADTLGSAKGWAASIRFSDLLQPQFENFKIRKDTFSLGVCNGCQLMSLIGWIDYEENSTNDDVPSIALLHNKSGRFECRWSTLKVASSNAIMLRRMQGSVLGCWVAHGEGRFSFKNQQVLKNLKASNSIALHYVDDDMKPTEKYPLNPNGSVEGIAAICSKDGRHLAMMPHPERCCEMFQWPFLPSDFKTENCPWQSMFNEANIWCCENKQN